MTMNYMSPHSDVTFSFFFFFPFSREFQMANVLDYPCLSQDQLLKRRDKDGTWLVDPESDGGGSASFREYVRKMEDENVDMFDKKLKEKAEKNDEL